MLIKAITSLIARATGRRLTVLTFHNVRASGGALAKDEIDASDFANRLRWLRAVAVIKPFDEALAIMKSGRGPLQQVAITFDDGYATNSTVVLPVLKDMGLRATFFVLPGLIGQSLWTEDVRQAIRGAGTGMPDLSDLGFRALQSNGSGDRQLAADRLVEWMKDLPDSQRRELVSEILTRCAYTAVRGQLMSEPQMRQLADAGMEIGSHSMTHPILSRVGDDMAEHEIFGSRDAIADIVGRPPRFFAYPNGRPGIDYTHREMRMVREAGYVAAFSTGWGALSTAANWFELPRFTPWEDRPWRFQLQLAFNLTRNPPTSS